MRLPNSILRSFIAGALSIPILIGSASASGGRSPFERTVNRLTHDLFGSFETGERILIADINTHAGLTPDLGRHISQLFHRSVTNNTDLIVIERQALTYLLSERRLAELGLVDESKAIEIGKQLGARKVLFGAISPFESNLILDLKVADIEKGVVDAATSLSIKKTGSIEKFIQSFPEIFTYTITLTDGRVYLVDSVGKALTEAEAKAEVRKGQGRLIADPRPIRSTEDYVHDLIESLILARDAASRLESLQDRQFANWTEAHLQQITIYKQAERKLASAKRRMEQSLFHDDPLTRQIAKNLSLVYELLEHLCGRATSLSHETYKVQMGQNTNMDHMMTLMESVSEWSAATENAWELLVKVANKSGLTFVEITSADNIGHLKFDRFYQELFLASIDSAFPEAKQGIQVGQHSTEGAAALIRDAIAAFPPKNSNKSSKALQTGVQK